MKRLFALFLISVFAVGLIASQHIDEAWTKDNYVKREVMLPMRDGTHLYTAIYEPVDNSVKHPILISRTPYGCHPYGNTFNSDLWRFRSGFLKKGYILVMQDVRGRRMSEGFFENVRPINPKHPLENLDIRDVYDSVDWLIKNTCSNGNVGFSGCSYLGYYAITAALARHKAIKAVCPQAPVSDWFLGDDIHHNGALALSDSFNFMSNFGVPRKGPNMKDPTHPPYFRNDDYSAFLSAACIKNISTMLADSIRFWAEMVQHPDYDDWWKSRSTIPALSNIKPAVLVVGGLFDAEDLYGTWNTFKAIDANSKNTPLYLLVGPWSHGAWAHSKGNFLGNIRFSADDLGKKFRDMELSFFNHFLLGEDGFSSLPKATVFITGSNEWASFSNWPPRDAVLSEWFLSPDGSLCHSAPTIAKSASIYTSDPHKPVPYSASISRSRKKEYMTDDQRFASRRPDVISFLSPVLDKDITVAGELSAKIWTSISTSDADLVVKLIDVFPDDFAYDKSLVGEGNGKNYFMPGYQMLVRADITRCRYRDSFSSPSPMTPGVPTLVNCRLQDIAHSFRKGHRIMVQIQSSWFPLFDRNPQQFVNIYNCMPSDFVKSDISIYHQADMPSSIVLPVINGDY